MMPLYRLAAVAAATALFAATPAAAIVKIATFSGTVASGYDQTGVFAAADSDLTGYTWVATYTYDTTLGTQNTDGATFDIREGGPNFGGGTSPVLSSSITINGVTRTVAGVSGYARTQNYPYVAFTATDQSDDGVTEIYQTIEHYAYPVGAPTSLETNFGPVVDPGFGNGYIQFYAYSYTSSTTTEFATAYLANAITYSVRDAVPEPANWALLIAGFSLVGTALRRRLAPAGVTA
jgi:hypothetical protein